MKGNFKFISLKFILLYPLLIIYLFLNHFREIFTLNDGGQVALDWLEPTKRVNYMYDATILFLPGLTGDSKCEYVRATSLAIQKSGFRIVVFNYRGIGGIELKVLK